MMLGTPTFVELRRQMDSKVLQLRVDLETFQDRIETDFQKLFRDNKEMMQKFASKVDLARIEQEAGGVSEMKGEQFFLCSILVCFTAIVANPLTRN